MPTHARSVMSRIFYQQAAELFKSKLSEIRTTQCAVLETAWHGWKQNNNDNNSNNNKNSDTI